MLGTGVVVGTQASELLSLGLHAAGLLGQAVPPFAAGVLTTNVLLQLVSHALQDPWHEVGQT